MEWECSGVEYSSQSAQSGVWNPLIGVPYTGPGIPEMENGCHVQQSDLCKWSLKDICTCKISVDFYTLLENDLKYITVTQL